jgi:hypothetical protein
MVVADKPRNWQTIKKLLKSINSLTCLTLPEALTWLPWPSPLYPPALVRCVHGKIKNVYMHEKIKHMRWKDFSRHAFCILCIYGLFFFFWVSSARPSRGSLVEQIRGILWNMVATDYNEGLLFLVSLEHLHPWGG